MPDSLSFGPKRVACVGASITFGLGLKARRRDCYPSVLGRLLGDNFRVRNFGYSGATAGKHTNEPYWETPSFTAATRFDAHIAVLMFGTNDAQHANQHGFETFEEDYLDLIDHFATLPARPAIVLIRPLPVFEPMTEIDIGELDHKVRPTVERIAAEQSLPLVDAFTPLDPLGRLFPDNLHPNAEGAKLLGELVHATLSKAALVG